jgi:hypothetical protein
MLFLFSNKHDLLQQRPLEDGAVFMKKKNSNLHPGNDDFYLTMQNLPKHECLGDLGPNSQFNNVNCRLGNGEAAIIIGHGGNDERLRDEAGRDVTDAALRLMAKIADDNPNGGYTFFLAACGGAKRQPGASASLLGTLVKGAPVLAEQLRLGTIRCGGYTAEAGLVELSGGLGLPVNLTGTHIYGTLADGEGVMQHCGYDSRITTQLLRASDGTYATFIFSPALYPLQKVIDWVVKDGCAPNMQTRFPHLYDTVKPTSK